MKMQLNYVFDFLPDGKIRLKLTTHYANSRTHEKTDHDVGKPMLWTI